MAAVTVANRRESVFGNFRVIMALVSGTGTSDTWVTGLHVIRGWSLDPGSANPPTAITVSGGTLTITAGGSYTSASAMAYGW